MATAKNRDIRLKSRPVGLPKTSDFELVESDVPVPGTGQVLVKNLYMSVDPYMRGRMRDRKSYVPPFQLGEILHGGAVGRVTASHDNGQFAAGDYVLSQAGWREWFVSDGQGLTKIDPSVAPVQSYLGTLGMPGLTAYAGLKRIGELKEGERVFVSAAAGAVGAVVCQIARNMGCRVVGSVGTKEKKAWLLDTLKIDEAINYNEETPLTEVLGAKMPGGIDVYFDNVGGRHLEAALDHMRQNGRIVACGMIDQYNATEAPRGPSNLMNIVAQRLTMKGFIVLDHMDLTSRFLADMKEWIAAGKMTWRETVIDGIEHAPEAVIGLFRGDNIGKMLVKLAGDA